MPRPFGSRLNRDGAARAQLEALVRASSTPQALAFRRHCSSDSFTPRALTAAGRRSHWQRTCETVI